MNKPTPEMFQFQDENKKKTHPDYHCSWVDEKRLKSDMNLLQLKIKARREVLAKECEELSSMQTSYIEVLKTKVANLKKILAEKTV